MFITCINTNYAVLVSLFRDFVTAMTMALLTTLKLLFELSHGTLILGILPPDLANYVPVWVVLHCTLNCVIIYLCNYNLCISKYWLEYERFMRQMVEKGCVYPKLNWRWCSVRLISYDLWYSNSAQVRIKSDIGYI